MIVCSCQQDSGGGHAWDCLYNPLRIMVSSVLNICPVCLGRGRIAPGFYEWVWAAVSTSPPEQCRSCGGKGYVCVGGQP